MNIHSLRRSLVLTSCLATSGCGSAPQAKVPQAVGTSASSTTELPADDTAPEDSGNDSGTTDSGWDTAADTSDPEVDADADGHPVETDCDDTDPSRYPGAPEVCDDDVVNDCEGSEWSARIECGTVHTHEDALGTWSLGTDQSHSFRVRGVGDIDGDGFDDLAIGEPRFSNSETSVGSVRLFYGPHTGQYSLGDEDVHIQGIDRWDSIGWDVAPMGDLDGDGFDDFAVGAADDHQNGEFVSGTPSVYVVHGPGALLDVGHGQLLVDTTSSPECLGSVLEPVPDSNGDGVADILVGGRCANVVRLFSGNSSAQVPEVDDITTFTGPDTESRFGHAIATGDLDGDGHLDVAIGDPDYYGDYNGSVSVFASPSSSTISYSDAAATVQAVDSDSGTGNVLLGTGVAIGDLNDDGYDDLATGAPAWTASPEWGMDEGLLSVYFGPVAGHYGVSDADFHMSGEQDRSMIGGEMRSGVDLDGDGADDLLVGNGYNEVNGTGASRYTRGTAAYLLHAPIPTGVWNAIDADVLFVDTSTSPVFGQHTSVLPDSNGDGRAEVLIGNWYETVHLFEVP